MTENDSTNFAARLENLTPAQRALFEQRLMERRQAVARGRTVSRRPVSSPCAVSYAQELLWLLSQVFDDGVAYNAPAAFRLKGPLDLELLQRSFDELVRRHEILRTTYTVIDGRPMQVIAPTGDVEVRLVDLQQLASEDQEAEAQRVLLDESRFAFDLERGPVLRPTVIRFAEDDHIFMLVLHHIATDGWSRSVLYRDLTTIYDALKAGTEPDLPALPIQYADYAVWHREWLESGVVDQQLDYWKQKLAGAPSRLDLPTDYPRPRIRSYLGDQRSLMLDVPTRDGLKAIAREHNTTLFVALVAVFSLLLGRHAGQSDVVIGTPFAGRNRTEFEEMVGYFINPLALRIDLSGDPSFAELLRRARDTVLEAFAHADVPYELVVRETNPERDLSQTPVFQAMILLHNPEWQTARPKFQPEGVRTTEITHEKGWAKFDVLLGMSERASGLNTTWEYSTELFSKPTVHRMMEHFRTLAGSAAADGDRPLSRVSMLSETERSQVLVDWNPPLSEPAARGTVKELFEAQAARTPDATAVVFEGERLTYAELNRRANRVAALLASHEVGAGNLVGVLMEKSLDLIPAVLGVVKAGGAYVPLDPLYPPDRLAFMVSDARPRALLTHRGLSAGITNFDGHVLELDELPLEGLTTENPPTTAGGEDPAYVIFTSGSTGQPKGVVIGNRNLVSAFGAYEDAYRLDELTCHLQMASFSFDVFTADLVRALLSGATLVLCPREVLLDPARLHDLIARERVDAAEFVPATASLLFDHVEREGASLEGLRFVTIGGEPWRNERYTAFKRLLPNARLVNSYGLTEGTMDSTWFEPDEDTVLQPGRFVPIGRPFSNTRVYVLDSSLEPVPTGIVGELCIGGHGVAQGYLNRPELTAERFVPDPFGEAGDRIYRTGDLARWLPDGTVDFIGRADRQLKVRGFRVEPGEVEAVLERHPAVRAAAVADRDDHTGDKRLVGYVVAEDPGDAPQPDELRAFVDEHLPAYMVPAGWVFLPALPLSPNGKVDLQALPDPTWDRSAAADEFVAPSTETEQTMAEIWCEVLSVDRVGVDDNFFELGGHSLLAVRLFGEIERRLGVRVPLAALFHTATVRGLAEIVSRDGAAEPADPADALTVCMRPGGDRPPLFLVSWAGGEVLGYRELVENLAPDLPVYGLRAPGADRERVPLATIEELATHYIEEVRRIQPQGPYLIGGYCFAAVVAYEMARQLRTSGEELAMVVLIDAHLRVRRPTRLELERMKFEALRQSNLRGKGAWLRRRMIGLKKLVGARLYFSTGGFAYDYLLAHPGRRLPWHPWNLVLVASSRARKAYVPPETDIAVTFFRAQEGPDERPTAWSAVAHGGVDLRPVIAPGVDHAKLMHDPYAPLLAAEMMQALDELHANRPGAVLATVAGS